MKEMRKPQADELWTLTLTTGDKITVKIVDITKEKTAKGKKTWVGIRYFDLERGKGFYKEIYEIRMNEFLEHAKPGEYEGKVKVKVEEEETEEDGRIIAGSKRRDVDRPNRKGRR